MLCTVCVAVFRLSVITRHDRDNRQPDFALVLRPEKHSCLLSCELRFQGAALIMIIAKQLADEFYLSLLMAFSDSFIA